MNKKPFSLWTDQDVCDWFDSLDEDYIRSLIDLHDDHDITPRRAFHYVFGDLDSQLCTCQACKLSLRPAPVQTPPSGSVAAPIEAAQGQGTLTLEQFQRWLENKAHNSAAVVGATEPRFSWSGDAYLDHSLVIAECRVATKLLMQFKLEQGV